MKAVTLVWTLKVTVRPSLAHKQRQEVNLIDCLIIGDSIAVGTKQFRPDCVAFAKGGINSGQWRRQYLEGDKGSLPLAETLIISLGSNDHKGVNTRAEIAKIRTAVTGKRVYWILPHGNNTASGVDIKDIQSAVREVAEGFGDTVLPINRVQTDNIHPSWAGYKELGANAK